ncbi:hypothetical protein CM15mP43_04670 [bacterium]|nr:MAG: hypothetical protein CM15mP43_04670 [bacterium]
MININRSYFFLLWALFSIFNSSYLLNFGPYIDPTLIMVVALSVLNTERIIIIFLIFILLFTQIFGSYISFFDLFLKLFLSFLGIYITSNFIWKSYENEIILMGALLLIYYSIVIFSANFFRVNRLFSLFFICNYKFYI